MRLRRSGATSDSSDRKLRHACLECEFGTDRVPVAQGARKRDGSLRFCDAESESKLLEPRIAVELLESGTHDVAADREIVDRLVQPCKGLVQISQSCLD